MSYHWVGERVATVDLMRVISNALDGKEDKNWGPNNRFRFPLRGGTGQIWRTLASRLPEGVFRPDHRCVRIETAKRMVHFEDGSQEKYDRLISTIPLDVLISLADVESLKTCVQKFRHSTVHVVGIGLKGAPPPHLKSKCWIYFPEDNCSFYRATVFSNYSPHNVPDITRYWSLMVEVSESPYKAVDRAGLLDSVMGGLLATKLIGSPNEVASVWMHSACHGYPTPFLGRDRLVPSILAELEKLNIYSRGRFGGWKYEVSNQDHSLMQGVELVSRLAFGTPEVTYWLPEVANGGRTDREVRFMASIVMPAYNEEEIVEKTVREWYGEVISRIPGSELIVVNDCSKDGTGEVLARLAREIPALRPLTPERNGGHGRALRYGFDHVTQDWVFQTDSDRQHLPSDFWKTLGACGKRAISCLGVRSHARRRTRACLHHYHHAAGELCRLGTLDSRRELSFQADAALGYAEGPGAHPA